MGYFEFLHGLRVICLPLNILENCIANISSKSYKRQRLIVFIFVNTMQYPHTLKNIYHYNKWGPAPLFHSDTNPVLGHVLVHSVDKTRFLVVTLELIWLLLLNILSLSLVTTPNKSLRFKRFRRSYVNRPPVVLIKVTMLFCLMCAVHSG